MSSSSSSSSAVIGKKPPSTSPPPSSSRDGGGRGSSRKRNLQQSDDDDDNAGDRKRETSRYAARDRRNQEAEVFAELRAVLPVVEGATFTHVDRIAMLRLATAFCRLRHIVPKLLTAELLTETAALWSEAELGRCLDGFAMICSTDAVILYVTESVADYLGLTQTDLIGRWLVDFVHQEDYEHFRQVGAPSSAAFEDRLLVLRMKSVVSPRGRQLNLRHALFKAIAFQMRTVALEDGGGARIHLLQASTIPVGQGKCYSTPAALGDTSAGTFMTRHTCDMRFSYANESITDHLGLDPRQLIGTSFYQLVHPADLPGLTASIRELFKKQHSRTPYYRLMGKKKGRMIWVQTEATVVQQRSKGQRSQYVICVHQLLGHHNQNDEASGGPAAVPVVVKVETVEDDSPDYLLHEPKSIECVSFTPLLSATKHSFRSPPVPLFPAAAGPEGRQGTSSAASSTAPAPDASYDEVLEWLLHDFPASPPPSSSSASSSSLSSSTQQQQPARTDYGSQLALLIAGGGSGDDDDILRDPSDSGSLHAAFFSVTPPPPSLFNVDLTAMAGCSLNSPPGGIPFSSPTITSGSSITTTTTTSDASNHPLWWSNMTD